MIIDASNSIVGRIATIAAKKALLGEEVIIINCENAYMSGGPDQLKKFFKQRIDRGIPLGGPYFPRTPERIVRRVIRGMLPTKKTTGREAFKRVNCFVGIPEEYKDKKAEKIKGAEVSKLPNLKFIKIMEISRSLGAKQWQK